MTLASEEREHTSYTPTRVEAIKQADYTKTLHDLLPGSVDFILTDPPYSISRKTGFSSLGANSVERFAVSMDFGEWDHQQIDLSQLAALSYLALREGGTAIVWYDLMKASYLIDAMTNAGFKMLRMLIWEKTNPVPLNQSVCYLTNAREIAVLGVRGKKPTFNAKYHSGTWRLPIPRHNGKRLHPTQKPLELFADLVKIHSNPGDLVVDPFLGSGTTAVAAIQHRRRFIGGDTDAHYVAVARERVRGIKATNFCPLEESV